MAFKMRTRSTDWLLLTCSQLQVVSTGNNDITVLLVKKVAGEDQAWVEHIQKHCNLPARLCGGFQFHPSWRCCCQKGKFMWSGSATFLASPQSPKSLTLWQVSVGYKSSWAGQLLQSKLRSMDLWGRRKRCANQMLLTGNIRQWKPLQINVQQVLGVCTCRQKYTHWVIDSAGASWAPASTWACCSVFSCITCQFWDMSYYIRCLWAQIKNPGPGKPDLFVKLSQL